MWKKKLKGIIYFLYWSWLFQWLFIGTELRKLLNLDHDAYKKIGWGSSTELKLSGEQWFTASGFILFNVGVIIDILILFVL